MTCPVSASPNWKEFHDEQNEDWKTRLPLKFSPAIEFIPCHDVCDIVVKINVYTLSIIIISNILLNIINILELNSLALTPHFFFAPHLFRFMASSKVSLYASLILECIVTSAIKFRQSRL